MRIGELAKRSGLSIDTLRFYEKRGLIKETHFKRCENRYREYTEATLEHLQLIRSAQAAGFSLSEIVELFELWEQDKLPEHEIIARLRQKHTEIAGKIAELRQIQCFLEQKLATKKVARR